MARGLTRLAGACLLALVAAPVVLVLAMRAKNPVVLDAVRRFNRSVTNPRQMATAGSAGAYASVIRHRGRTSANQYETPIQVVTVGDGFAVALPYGARADWVRNVLASGSATILSEGHTYRVARPEIVPLETLAFHFSPGEQRNLRLFGVETCLLVRRA
jgi:deazaflavin-dependent oxidoreductase (nitroreductase family)